MDVTFFESAAALREWLDAHAAGADELWLGLRKVGSGQPSVTYGEMVDEVLRVGWIDGVRKSIDGTSWAIRLTPRRARSIWSQVNLRRYADLEAQGRMTAAGRAAYEKNKHRTNRYSFEQDVAALDPAYERVLRADGTAAAFWDAQPPSYRKTASWWVMSAKRAETRDRRLRTLVEDSRNGLRVAPLRRREPS